MSKQINLLFLDIDWVLLPIWKNTWSWNKKNIPIHIYNFLHELYKRWVNFIIHSSWRNFLLDLNEFWKYNNLPIYIWNTSLNKSKEDWIIEVLDNLNFDIKQKDIFVKVIILDDDVLDIRKISSIFNSEIDRKITISHIKPISEKGLTNKEIKLIKDFFF